MNLHNGSISQEEEPHYQHHTTPSSSPLPSTSLGFWYSWRWHVWEPLYTPQQFSILWKILTIILQSRSRLADPPTYRKFLWIPLVFKQTALYQSIYNNWQKLRFCCLNSGPSDMPYDSRRTAIWLLVIKPSLKDASSHTKQQEGLRTGYQCQAHSAAMI